MTHSGLKFGGFSLGRFGGVSDCIVKTSGEVLDLLLQRALGLLQRVKLLLGGHELRLHAVALFCELLKPLSLLLCVTLKIFVLLLQ